jgi:hypothetical protein
MKVVPRLRRDQKESDGGKEGDQEEDQDRIGKVLRRVRTPAIPQPINPGLHPGPGPG